MTIVVFTGPTLASSEAGAILKARYRPPAAKGDVYREALNRPRAIALIDGSFQRVAAVWHKEILWAMYRGIHVFGAASIGALRAAELAPFGMRGCGRIFEGYLDGRIEDDDEVAVVHGPAEVGFRPLSEAMVNIRVTLGAAEAAGVIATDTRLTLEALAKAQFFPRRSYTGILQLGAELGLPDEELESLAAWLVRHAVNQKSADARELLERLRFWAQDRPEPLSVEYTFEETDMWRALVEEVAHGERDRRISH